MLAQTVTPPQRPFSQLIELWTRQLDRIAYRSDQESLVPAEIDALREQASDVRAAAFAAAALARNELADTRKLLAPLETKPGADQAAETDAVKAERERLTEQATISESRVKQCEVVIARADQLLERLTKLRGQVVLQTLLHKDASPLSRQVWSRLWPQLLDASRTLSAAFAVWSRDGLRTLVSGEQDLAAAGDLGRGHDRAVVGRPHPAPSLRPGVRALHGPHDRTIAAAIDGLGLVLVPILAVWLIGRLLLASQPPSPIDVLIPHIITSIIIVLLVVGLSATLLAPTRPARRVLDFTDSSAQHLSTSLRRLMIGSTSLEILFVAFTQGSDRGALASVGALVLATTVALLALPVLSNKAWHAREAEGGDDRPALVGGTWWTASRVVLRVAILSSILFALLGYATLAAHIHSALANSGLMIVAALLAHRVVGDLLDTMAAPETPTGAWARRVFGLAPQQTLYGQHIVLLLFDCLLVLLLAFGLPQAWNVDVDAIERGFGQLLYGVRIGGVTISLANVGMAILTFAVCLLLARLVRGIVRDRVMPTVEAPMPLRQSIDAGLNYAGVIIARAGRHRRARHRFHQPGDRAGRALGRHWPRPAEHRQQHHLGRRPADRAADQGRRLGVGDRPRGLRAAHQHPRHRDRDLPAHARHRAQQRLPAEPGDQPHLFRHVEPGRDPAHGRARHRRREVRGDPARVGAQSAARAARAAADRPLRPDRARPASSSSCSSSWPSSRTG